MNAQNKCKSTVFHINIGAEHECLTASITREGGHHEPQDAVSLSDLRSALEGSGNTIGFSDYLAFEAMLRDDYENRLIELSSLAFSDDVPRHDYEETADYKRGLAKFLLHRDLNQRLYWCRERLMKTAEAT